MKKPKLGLGTANFGMTYGALADERVSFDDVRQIVDRAHVGGFALVDTAPAYGNAEEVLGEVGLPGDLRTVTKTIPLLDRPEGPQLVENTFRESLRNLGRDRVDAVLVHQVRDLMRPDATAIWERLLRLKGERLIDKIGVSIYDEGELLQARECGEPEIVQLPINVFSQRLFRDGTLARLRRIGVEIHARSAFLQGIIVNPPESLPSHLRHLERTVRQFHKACAGAGCSPLEGALGFLRTLPIDVVIVGAQEPAQLDGVLEVWQNDIPDLNWEQFDAVDPTTVDPRKWSK